MKNSSLYLIALSLALSAGCKSREFNSETAATNQPQLPPRVDLSGNSLGYIDYKGNIGRRAVRIYSKKVDGVADTYNTVIVEYPPILSVFPRFVSTPKSEEDIQDGKFTEKFINDVKSKINARIGDLKHILARVTVYRTVPKAGNASAFELRRLRYDTTAKSLIVDNSSEVSVLTLAEKGSLDSPLAGATISAAAKGEPAQITVPKTSKGNGIEWQLVNLAYSAAKLDSTWRSDFLNGAYLSTYGNRKNVILNLSNAAGSLQADFLDAKAQNIPSTEFTNPLSAEIIGKYDVKAAQPGIFVFTPKVAGSAGSQHVETKLGLFIDVFDATKSLNMDVVELVLVDENTPTKFHMYFEDPENGEGQK